MAVILNLDERALRLEVFDNGLSRFISVHARIFRIVIGNLRIICEDIDHRKIVTKSDLKVIRVMGRCNFDNARSEVYFNIIIGNNGDLPVDYREYESLADYILISLIVRVDRNGCVAQKGFGSGGCKLKVSAAVLERIAQMPEVTRLILIFNLGVRN